MRSETDAGGGERERREPSGTPGPVGMSEGARVGPPPKLLAFMEVQDRQYDPEHWLGGNIDPVFTARRPNRWGYVLLVGAIFATIGLIFYPDSSICPEKIEIALLALLQYWAGFVLLRPRKVPSDPNEMKR